MYRYNRRYEARIAMMHKWFDFRGKSVLDLGCNSGYVSRALGATAGHVLGVDSDADAISVAGLTTMNFRVKYWHTNITPEFIRTTGHWDVTVMLSVLHHILTASACYQQPYHGLEYATELLRAIREKSDALFLETAMPNEFSDWVPFLPHMTPDPESWIRNLLFQAGFRSVIKLPPPMLEISAYQRWLHRHMFKVMSKTPRPLRELIGFDDRDVRPLFLAR